MKIGLIGIKSLEEENHFLMIRNALKTNLRLIYSPNKSEVIPLSRLHNIKVSSSVSELLDAVDAVYFANSLKHNYEFATMAIKASCHLFIEDISELSLEEIKQLYKVGFEAGVKIQLKLTKTFSPEYLEIKDQVQSPKFIEIHKSFSSFLRKKDYFTEILNNLNCASLCVKSSIKKINTLLLPVEKSHFSLVHINIIYDNGAVVNIKLNNISDTEESSSVFHESDKIIKIDFRNHFSVVLQLKNAHVIRSETPAKKENAFDIEMYNFINTCKNFDAQSISEAPQELKIIQSTISIMEQLDQSSKSF